MLCKSSDIYVDKATFNNYLLERNCHKASEHCHCSMSDNSTDRLLLRANTAIKILQTSQNT